ncbi:MAG: mannose/fructose/sorbose PTS transporter subunit IIB [Burkholderiales bacterium]|nr:mannose/fructose/sorbose PTS transporter subunit IIB [Burkholderiales bacterium]
MNIVLVRIDDRLIHGQVTTIWSKGTKCQRIIVCNDDVAKDLIRKTLLEQAVPTGIKASVIGINKAIRVYNNSKHQNDRVLLLFTNPSDVVRMVEGGVDIKSVNIGGMSFKTGKKQITSAISVDNTDVEAFKKLNKKGIELEIRKVFSDSKVNLMSKLKNQIRFSCKRCH